MKATTRKRKAGKEAWFKGQNKKLTAKESRRAKAFEKAMGL